jgi:hypothetical protein
MKTTLAVTFISLMIALPLHISAEYILPDKHFIQTECAELIRDAKKHLPSALLRIKKLCVEVTNRQIDPDDWMIQLDPIAREVDRAIPCPNCRRVYLDKRQPVPKGFSTYILALIPSPELAENSKWIWDFRKKFDALGDSIGEKNAAIWLGQRYGESINIERNKGYCDLYNLNYNDGPYIVVTNKRPDLVSAGDEIIFVKLSNISADRVSRVMNLLEQDLRKERDIRRRILLFEEVKQRLLSAIERNESLQDIVVSWLKK